jgi:hypothetical protein
VSFYHRFFFRRRTKKIDNDLIPPAQRVQDKAAVPPVVRQVLNRPGEPLDAATQTRMHARFGRDFSQVRVHTDEEAAASARTIEAAAYTFGDHIVFGDDQYAPGTAGGDALLAHELAHVTQQTSQEGQAPTQIAAANSLFERDAQGAEQSNQARPPGQLSATGRPQAGTIQRSLAGGIAGGVGLGLMGAVIGGALGGVAGALIGGAIGLIGGAILGNALTTRERPLTPDEINYARRIYVNSIDFSKVTITRDSMYAAGAPRTIGNTIHLKSSWGHFEGDTLNLTDQGRTTLIHELGHVWQYQNGGLAYIPQSLAAQFSAWVSGGDRGAAYDWEAAHNAGIPWEEWNPEQQAEAIEEYNKRLGKIEAGTATLEDYAVMSRLLPYIEKVRRGEGAPTFEPMNLEDVPF